MSEFYIHIWTINEWTDIEAWEVPILREAYHNEDPEWIKDCYTLEFCHMCQQWSYRLCPRAENL